MLNIDLYAITIKHTHCSMRVVDQGPWWGLLERDYQLCADYWWANLLYINTLYPWNVRCLLVMLRVSWVRVVHVGLRHDRKGPRVDSLIFPAFPSFTHAIARTGDSGYGKSSVLYCATAGSTHYLPSHPSI